MTVTVNSLQQNSGKFSKYLHQLWPIGGGSLFATLRFSENAVGFFVFYYSHLVEACFVLHGALLAA
ncbi:hypothetical protein [Parvularcula lutaonensis]|uniref:hypothetical protein n=1 Tax=Parvularcula lutaonensis TaxID=491923 RepID=UPI00167A0958|nr:hypothetical protein [Parvularcula lutaonensis]